MFCDKCGTLIKDGAKFCGKCGNKLAQIEEIVKPPYPLQPKKKKTGLIIAIIVILLVAVGVVFFLNNSKKDTNKKDDNSKVTKEKDDQNSSGQNGKGKEPVSESDPVTDEPKIIVGSISAKVTSAAYSGDALAGAVVTLTNSKGDTITLNTEANGYATFENLEYGEYHISYSYDNCFSIDRDVTLNGDTAYDEAVMVTIPEEGCAAVVIQWNSNTDIDVCGYNSDTKETVHIAKSTKKAKNVNPAEDGTCVFYDDKGVNKTEVLYVAGINDSIARTTYVLDYTSMLNNTTSLMEGDGIIVTVYTHDGEVAKLTPASDMTASLWQVGYFYEGVWYTDPNYIDDLSEFKWALQEKE